MDGTEGPSRPDWAAAGRDALAEERDRRADAVDGASAARDVDAAARDERAEAREAGGDTTEAARDRAGALRDRMAAASDRSQAADDRQAASRDRRFSAADRAAAAIDELTGTYRREAGLILLDHDLVRARRTNQPFTLAFVDVDGLQAVNAAEGHAAGDRLLRATIDAIKLHLRPYDVVTRYGGDEFLCGLLDLTLASAGERFALANAALAVAGEASVSVGFAAFEADDTLDDLIARGDRALYASRGGP